MAESSKAGEEGQPAAAGLSASEATRHRQSVADLVAEHNRALHAFLMSRLRDEHEAREVAQEAYAQLLQLERPGAVSFLRAYLFKTASNIAINRQKQYSNQARLLQIAFDEGAVDEITPDRITMGGEELQTFERALAELPVKCRRAFVLSRLHGHREEEIAAELDIQPRMVRRYTARAGAYCQMRIAGMSAEQAREAAP